jgi:hypothetical protein
MKEIKKFLESNENEDTHYQSLWDVEFIDMSIHIKKLVRSQINNLMMDVSEITRKTRAIQSQK